MLRQQSPCDFSTFRWILTAPLTGSRLHSSSQDHLRRRGDCAVFQTCQHAGSSYQKWLEVKRNAMIDVCTRVATRLDAISVYGHDHIEIQQLGAVLKLRTALSCCIYVVALSSVQ